jgi:hypothetical protein
VALLINIFAALFAFGFGAAFLYSAIKQQRQTSLVENTPTETVNAVSMGRTELEGDPHPNDHVLTQPFTDGDAVFVWYRIEERERRPLTGSSKQAPGSNRWVVVDEGEEVVPFAVKDGTGKVYIDLNDSPEFKISNENRTQTLVRTWQSESSKIREFLKQYRNVSPKRNGLWGVLDGVKRRFTQVVLPTDETMYVFGGTRRTEDGVPVIGRDEETGEFIISDKPADELEESLRMEVIAVAAVGLGFFVAGFLALMFGVPVFW